MLSWREFPADVSGTLATTPQPVRVMFRWETPIQDKRIFPLSVSAGQ